MSPRIAAVAAVLVAVAGSAYAALCVWAVSADAAAELYDRDDLL